MDISLVINVVIFSFYLLFTALLVTGHRHVRELKEVPLPLEFPPVSVVIAARNEERNIEEALCSVLAQDYSDYEVIVVDDRSTDRTAEILHAVSQRHPRLKIIRISELPNGWLGKNHALHVGASRASGDYILFTDADVVMAPSTLSRAMGHLLSQGYDHLAVGPEARMPGAMLNAFMGAFMLFFTLYVRPWDVPNPRRSAHVGIGAFNLLKTSAYRHAGGHRTIALRPDDDMKLGKILKKKGFRQGMALGRGMLHVEWYASVTEAVRGLEKNAYAGLDYSPFRLVCSTVGALLVFVYPFVAFLFSPLLPALFAAGSIILLTFVYLYCAHLHGLPKQYLAGFLPATFLLLFIIWRSAVLVYLRDGIEWRGTRYSLKDLKGNRI